MATNHHYRLRQVLYYAPVKSCPHPSDILRFPDSNGAEDYMLRRPTRIRWRGRVLQVLPQSINLNLQISKIS